MTTPLDLTEMDMTSLNYRKQKVSAYISQFHLLNLSTSLGVSYMSTTFSKMSLDDSAFDSWFEPNRFFTPFTLIIVP